MVASANIRHCARRLIVAAWSFAACFLFGDILTTGKADASCGDYLLHGPTHSLATGDYPDLHDGYGGGWSSNQRELEADSLPHPPASPCANGRCQSAPPHPPASSPTRAVYIKQPVVIDALASLGSDPDAMNWLYPADGLRPEGPSIAVDLPPPKRGC